MGIDYRADVARHYDLHTDPYDDVSFYVERLRNRNSLVLELGCGTGRVLLPLAEHCGHILGLDISESMLAVCEEKLLKASISKSKARVEVGDISDFDLGEKFDLIIAPFRVFQCLDSEEQIDGFFDCIKTHLAPSGRCVLNVFKTLRKSEELEKMWSDTDKEHLIGEWPCDDGKVVMHEIRDKFRREPLTIYPKQIIRRYKGKQMAEEYRCNLSMRCYYADEFEKLITNHGFEITDKWGGYSGEKYGEGNELIIEFTNPS